MAEEKNRFPVQMTRKGMLVSGALIFFIMGWMFILGILVGRGTAPIPIKTNALERQLNELKAAMLTKEKADGEAISRASEAQVDELGFYEALKKTPAKATAAAIAPAPARRKPPQPPAGVPDRAAHPETAVKRRKTPPPETRPRSTEGRHPPAASSSSHEAHFTVQVAAFRDSQSAERMVQELRTRNYPGYSVRTEVKGKGAWYRVRVGAFESRAAAQGMLKRLNADRLKGIVMGTK